MISWTIVVVLRVLRILSRSVSSPFPSRPCPSKPWDTNHLGGTEWYALLALYSFFDHLEIGIARVV